MFEFVTDLSFFQQVIVFVITVILCLCLNAEYCKNSCVPPGPYGLPWVGYLPWLNHNGLNEQLAELCKSYKTDILCFTVLGRYIVVLNTFELAKEVFKKRRDVSDRVDYHGIFTAVIPNYTGVAATSGWKWREARRFTLSNLRDLGMGHSIETIVQEEASILCDSISDMSGEPFDPQSYLNTAIANVTCRLVFGQRFDHNDREFLDALTAVNKFVGEFHNELYFLILNNRLLQKFPLNRQFCKIRDAMAEYTDFAKRKIEEHRKNFNGQDGDLIYRFLIEIEKGLDPDVFDDAMLDSVVYDLLLAGSDNTSLRWCLLAMLAYPEICKKVREELDHVIGEREPQMKDKKNTPYTEAVINEAQRHFTLLPIGMAHSNLDHDIDINGYRIPKGSFVVANLDHIHHHAQDWKSPNEFDPENFLEEGKVVHTEKLVSFGIGRRACAGESLARTELYVLFASLMKNFDIRTENESCKADLTGIYSAVYQPKPFKLRMNKRMI